MTESIESISTLRQRIIEDMIQCRLHPRSLEAYLHAVTKLTRFPGRSPDAAVADDLRRFQLHQIKTLR